MKKFKQVLLAAIVMAIVFPAQAQEEKEIEKEKKESKFDKERLFFGGNLGLSFGDMTFINISPQVGYQFSQYFAAGGGINFISSSYTIRDYNGDKLYKDSYSYEMKKNKKGKCFFLKENQCCIYEFRPIICRFYPFELKFDLDQKYA